MSDGPRLDEPDEGWAFYDVQSPANKAFVEDTFTSAEHEALLGLDPFPGPGSDDPRTLWSGPDNRWIEPHEWKDYAG